MEKWKKIEGYEHYKVSTHGRVMNYEDGKIKIQYLSDKGYPRVRLYDKGKNKDPYVHRLVAVAFIKNPLGKPQINHMDGVKTNNRVENLRWCTNRENFEHAIENGLFRDDVSGEDHHRTKLTNKQALEIRNAIINTAFKRKMLAKKYGVSESVIKDIRYGRSFRHL
jgi:hypothetical protein